MRGTALKSAVGLAIAIMLLIVAWYHTFTQMWLRWFPAWPRHDLSLVHRLTQGDSYYTHGPLVPIASGLLAWFIYKRVGLPAGRTRRSAMFGWALLGFCTALHLLSVYARVTFVSGFALVGVMTAVLLICGGATLLRAYWAPLLLLCFMVPMPMDWLAKLNYQLKFVAGEAAIGLATHLFGVSATLEGSFIHVDSALGEPVGVLVLENVCSGLRSLIALTWFAAMFALVCRARGLWRWGLLAAAVPLAMGCNILRITTLVLVASDVGLQPVMPGGWFHEWSGPMMFIVALGALMGMEHAIVALDRLLHRRWTDLRLLGFLDRLAGQRYAPPAGPGLAVITLLALTAALSVIWSQQVPAASRSDVARHAVPQTIVVNNAVMTGRDVELDPRTLTILETDDYLYRRFTDADGQETVTVLIVFSPDNRKGTHPPEVCLEGSGQQVIDKQSHQLPTGVPVRGLLTRRDDDLAYHLYVYKCGSHYTTSFLEQQAMIFINALASRNASGALLRLTVPVEGQNIQAAQRLALAAAEQVVPFIDQHLP